MQSRQMNTDMAVMQMDTGNQFQILFRCLEQDLRVKYCLETDEEMKCD